MCNWYLGTYKYRGKKSVRFNRRRKKQKCWFKWTPFCTSVLRGNYTMPFGNFILYYNFLTNPLKFQKVYIFRKEIRKTKNHKFWENYKQFFLSFFFGTELQQSKIVKNYFFVDFFNWERPFSIFFWKIFTFLTLFCIKLKISKNAQNEKMQHLDGCISL